MGRRVEKINSYGFSDIKYYYKIKDGILINFGKSIFNNKNKPIGDIFDE
jgi:hypothetical protein